MRCWLMPPHARPGSATWATGSPGNTKRSQAWRRLQAGVAKANRPVNMLFLQFTILSFVAVTATAVVLTRDPAKQAIGISFYGLVMALMFFIFQAPDVALSQIVIGAVALPLMILLALTKIRRHEEEEQERRKEKKAA